MKKYAVVTGASGGIGREFATLLAADQYDLLLVARDRQELQEAAKQLESEYSISAEILVIDLNAVGAADKVWDATRKKQVDVLINNAGFGDLARLVDADWKKLENMINLNITTLTRLSQLAAQSMSRNGSGKILNVASIAGFIPGPGMATYYATKAYVLSFTEALAQELSTSGVSVTALCPGPTKTHFAETAGATKSGIFSGNLPTPKQVAAYGYDALKKGKVVAVHTFKNKIAALVLPRLAPRFIIRKVVDKAQN